MANDVKVLKLITGEEVIARVTESDIQITEGDGVDILILEAPMKITTTPKPEVEKNYLTSVTGLTL